MSSYLFGLSDRLYFSLRLYWSGTTLAEEGCDHAPPRPATPAASAACSKRRRFKYTDSAVISDGWILAESPGRGCRISIGSWLLAHLGTAQEAKQVSTSRFTHGRASRILDPPRAPQFARIASAECPLGGSGIREALPCVKRDVLTCF